MVMVWFLPTLLLYLLSKLLIYFLLNKKDINFLLKLCSFNIYSNIPKLFVTDILFIRF